MSVKVVKFGGSSLADAGQFRRVKEIIESDPARKYVVPSAPGKRFSGDEKVTDMLLECYRLSENDENIDTVFSKICERYQSIIADLGVEIDLIQEFEYIREAIKHHAGKDYVASRGEYLNGLILAKYLNYSFVDPKKYILFKENGTFDAEETNSRLKVALEKREHAVIPGFYGSMPNGTIKTFSRGGSDITGAIVARAVNAVLYENWTDVSGFLMADPRHIKNPKPIDTITYRELRELSYMGATVLHEESIFPVRYAGIPINIRNTNRPQDKGSMIVASAKQDDNKDVITGLAGKTGFSILNIEKEMMNGEVGFVRKVLEALENFNIGFEHIPSGIDTMSIIIHTAALEGKREQLINEICRVVNPGTIFIEDRIALIAVVGRGMIKAKGTAAKIFNALADANINIKMIDQGSSELNIIVGVEEKDFSQALNSIYNAFIN